MLVDGDQLPVTMDCNNTNYNNQEQYIENCNEYGDYQPDFPFQNQTPYGNNYGQLATPHSGSLETSRQNSYERDERQYYDINNVYNGHYQDYSPSYDNGEMNDGDYDDGALFYNSRPMKYKLFHPNTIEICHLSLSTISARLRSIIIDPRVTEPLDNLARKT